MIRSAKIMTFAAAAGLVFTGALAGPTTATASEEAQASASTRAAVGPCGGPQQIVFKKGSNWSPISTTYWFSLQNCFSSSQRVKVFGPGWPGSWSSCRTLSPGQTWSLHGAIRQTTSWQRC